MENLQKALDAQDKALEKGDLTKAEEKKHQKAIEAASAKDDAIIQDEIDAITQQIEAEIAEASKDDRVWSTENTVKEMKAEAKSRGIKGYSKMKEAELIKALNA